MTPTRAGVREPEWKTLEFGSLEHFNDACNANAAQGWSLHHSEEVSRAVAGSSTNARAILATFHRDKQTVLIVKHT